jgi:hypothetical protein
MAIQEKLDNRQQRQLTPRDLFVLTLLSQQRALNLDHLPRFLTLEGKIETEQSANLKSTTHNLVERLQHAGLIQVQRLDKNNSWIWLTKRGMQLLGLSTSSWKRPTRRILPVLHAANTLRLHFTEHDPQAFWLSQQQLRKTNAAKEPSLLPTAVLGTGKGERIAIYVALRLIGTEEQLAARMLKQLDQETHLEKPMYNALWYYATEDAAKRLRTARAIIADIAAKEIARKICIFSYPLVCRQALYRGHRTPVQTLAWSRDGKWIASASEDELHIWDTVTGKERIIHNLAICPSVSDWSRDGKWIALGHQDGKLTFWEEATDQLRTDTLNNAEEITGLAWSPLNEHVAVLTQDKLRIYDQCHTLQWESHRYPGIETLAWSPDGTRLALGGNDTYVHLINAMTGKHLQKYKKHGSVIQILAWAPDSQWLASVGKEPAILIWDAASGKKRRTIRELSTIDVLSWSPDGTKLACAGNEPYIHVWDVITGRKLLTYTDHAGEITSLAWSPDGTMLASASTDSTVHVYPVAGGPR